MIKILLVDSHKIFTQAIRLVLESKGDFRVVGEVKSGKKAVEFCRKTPPNVVLMEVSLSELNGIDATIEIVHRCPATKVVILSERSDEESVVGAIKAGVKGYILKSSASVDDLLRGIRMVASGEGSYLSPEISELLRSLIQSGEKKPSMPALDLLSPRELQMVRLVAEGKTSKDIARLLNLEVQTVRTYRKTMMKKIGASGSAEVVRFAFFNGLINKGENGVT
jgi:DNA-binding NarL/FixJ family response regulator